MSPIIPVFIASPSDVSRERKYAVEATRKVSAKLASVFGIALIPITWEEFAPISSGDARNPQYNILKRIKAHSIFIGILHNRYGTKIPEMNDISGTESEFDHALKHRRNIQILTYFRKIKDNKNLSKHEIDQISNLNKLKEKLSNKNVLHHNYLHEQDFRRRIVLDLFEAALNVIKQPTDMRLDHYEKFFHFGSDFQEQENSVKIVYPPISDPMFGHQNCLTDWNSYLLPTVVLEDTKAIQSLENTMNLMGKNFQTVMNNSPEQRFQPRGDRLWVCISRNSDSQKTLESLGSRPRFNFIDKQNSNDGRYVERQLIWRSKEGENITITSPLSKYLKVSTRPVHHPEWEPSFGFTYAKDYAILARFCVKPDEDYEPDRSFYYYYLGGIRALGTWGAGWFIENHSAELAKIVDNIESESTEDTPDIQLLLEVTYRNYSIIDVRNVSDEDNLFFSNRNSDEYIQKQYRQANTHM